ncbi:LysR family transcriptional regulator [Azospirillum sp. HJ39]|uniref:LysR family transcriptional regulator n=1 Tax=Azospirillum sp. HJ39 TaxID=3159496 RepID=UPI003555C7BD
MRSRQLESFILVCELGSISKAGLALNIAQPALGVQIRALEREFRSRCWSAPSPEPIPLRPASSSWKRRG